MAIAARRLGLDPAELARRNLIPADEMPYRTPSGALYDSGDYEACLDEALELADYDALRRAGRRARAEGRPRRDRARLHRRALDLEHGLHHARPDRRRARADAAEVGQRRGRVDRDRPARRHHRPARDDAAGPGPPHGLRAGRRRRARLRSRRTSPCCPRWTRRACPGRSPRATTRRASPGVAVGAVQAAALKLRAKIDAIRAHAGDETLSLRRVAGMAHWNPEGLPDGEEPGLAAVAFWAPPTLDPPDADDRVASSAAHGFIVDVCAVEVDRETGRGARARLRHRPRRRAGCSTRCSPTARCSAASPTASRRRCTSGTSTTSRAT